MQPIPGLALVSIGAHNSSAVVLNSITIAAAFLSSNTIGAAGAGGYWQIGTATANIGTPAGDGSGVQGQTRCKLDFGTGAGTFNVLSAGTSATDVGFFPVQLLCVNAANVVNVLSGSVGLATNVPGEVSTVGTVNVSGRGAVLTMGAGVTWTTADIAAGGSIVTNSAGASTVLNVDGTSSANVNGTVKIGTLTVASGGKVIHNIRNGGVITTTLNNYGTVDFSGAPAAGTITTLTAQKGSNIVLNGSNPAHITLTTETLGTGVGRKSYG